MLRSHGLMLAVAAIVGGASATWVLMDVLPARLAEPERAVPAAPLAQPPGRDRSESAAVTASAPPSVCPSGPVLAAAPGDGLFALDALAGAADAPTARSYARAAEEVAATGRARDAEVAWIAACRIAQAASGARSVPVADMLTRLARHYMSIPPTGQPAAALQDMQRRAEELLADSAAIYSAVLGNDASKTRHAQKAMASLAQAPEPASDDAGDEAAIGAVVMGDPDLAQMDSDLRRLQAQAAAVTQDPQGFRRRSAQAQARAAACGRDRHCLLNWYAQRRSQLIDEF